MWRILGRDKPTLGLQPKPFGEVCYSFFQGGDLIKNDESDECLPEELKAMRVLFTLQNALEEDVITFYTY